MEKHIEEKREIKTFFQILQKWIWISLIFFEIIEEHENKQLSCNLTNLWCTL